MRFLFLGLSLFIGTYSSGQIAFGPLSYNGFNTYTMSAFHLLDDGSMIAAFRFHSGHEFCGGNEYQGAQVAIIRFSEGGEVIWKKCFIEGSHSIVSITPYEGGFACLGSSNKEVPGKGRFMRFWALIIDEDGKVLKEYLVGERTGFPETIICASVCPDGSFIAGGKVTVTSSFPGESYEIDMMVKKVSKEGELEWQVTDHQAFWEQVCSITPSKFGGYIAGGYRQFKGDKIPERKGTAWVWKIDGKGKIKWQKNYGSGHYDYVSGLIETEQGDIVCMGRETGREDIKHGNCGSQGFWIAGLNKDGHIKWENFLMNRGVGTGAYQLSHAIYPLEDGGFLIGGVDVSNLRTSKLWVGSFSSDGVLKTEETAGERTCHGVYYIAPKGDKYLVTGWNQGYNTFHDGKLDIPEFDTWTMEVELNTIAQKVKPIVQSDTTLSHTVSYESQKENGPHLYVQVHVPAEQSMHVYPNPAHDFVNIDLSTERADVKVTVYNMRGKVLMQTETTNTSIVTLEVGTLKSGTYMVLVQADGVSKSLRLIKS